MEENAQQPLRIAHVIGKMMSGGVESAVMNYYRHIDKSKVQFDFIIDEDSTIVPYDEIESLGGKVYKIPPYQRPFAYHKALVRLLRENDYRIVHSHINSMSVFPLFAAKRAGVPVRIAHSHSTAGKGETLRNILKYSLRPFSRIFPTHYCACSEHAGRWLFGNKLYDTGKVTLVRNAIDLSKFKFDPQVREAVREELGIRDKFAAVHVGRFVKTKNHSFLIDVFEQVHKRNPNSVLLLVGEGELEQEIRDKFERLKLTNCVLFLGIRDDVHDLLQGADVFLLTSLYEGLGMVAIEAQAVGLPSYVSDTVSDEAILIPSLCKTISLESTSEVWASRVLDDFVDYDRTLGIKFVRERGYDISTGAKFLKEHYHSFFTVGKGGVKSYVDGNQKVQKHRILH